MPPVGISYQISFLNTQTRVPVPDKFIISAAPIPPSDLKLEQTDAKTISASWTPVKNAKKYRVTVHPSVGADFSIIISNSDFAFGSESGTSYTFNVSSIGDGEAESTSTSASTSLRASRNGLQHLTIQMLPNTASLTQSNKIRISAFVDSLWPGSIVQCTGTAVNQGTASSTTQSAFYKAFNVCAYMQSISPKSFFSIPAQLQSVKSVVGMQKVTIVDIYLTTLLDQIKLTQSNTGVN